jgi:hypothetical protein
MLDSEYAVGEKAETVNRLRPSWLRRVKNCEKLKLGNGWIECDFGSSKSNALRKAKRFGLGRSAAAESLHGYAGVKRQPDLKRVRELLPRLSDVPTTPGDLFAIGLADPFDELGRMMLDMPDIVELQLQLAER